MFERIKDFFYDISDILVSLLIIAVIFLAVSWKISDTLQVDTDAPVVVQTPTESAEPSSAAEDTDPTGPDTSTEPAASTEPGDASSTEDNASTEPGQPTTAPAPTAPTTAAPTAPTTAAPTAPLTTAKPVDPASLETFVIKEGELGYTIGKNLKAQGFIVDVDSFVKRLIETGYDGKLLSGSFKLSKKDSLDTIIRVLAGKSR